MRSIGEVRDTSKFIAQRGELTLQQAVKLNVTTVSGDITTPGR
jgi:DUF4097 and DUF4098 domain-containing protein YvlB